MSGQRNSPGSYEAGEALEQYRRVVPTAGGTVTHANAVDFGFGVTQQKAVLGGHVAVRHYNHGGTSKMEAAGAIPINEQVYAADEGRIAATGTKIIGTAKQAASGLGSVIEIIPHVGLTAISSSSSSSSSSSAG